MANRSRQSLRKSPSTPPQPTHGVWSHSPSSYSNPTLQHSEPGYPLGHARPQQRYFSSQFAAPSKRPMYTPDYSPTYPSSPASFGVEGASGSSTPKGALKVLSSVKRSFSINNTKKSGPSASYATSTAEETAAAQIRIADSTSSKPPPTVQEIAAGLVTGLRPLASRRTTFPRPAPPARSSLKKSTLSNTSSSSSASLASTSLMSTRTGSTTTAATSVASSRRPRFSLKDALFGRSASASPTPIAARKAVRFHVDRSPTVEHTPLPS